MAWDSTRKVPWRRLVRDWLLYLAVVLVIFLIVFRDRISSSLFIGLLISGPMFVVVGAVLAKLGYQRKTLRDLRAESAERAVERGKQTTTGHAGARSKPPPTKRTAAGPAQRPSSKRKR
jgi:hypothetical protein